MIGLLVSNRTLDFNDVLAKELAVYPPSMFDASGKMKSAKAKSVLKTKLQVEVPIEP